MINCIERFLQINKYHSVHNPESKPDIILSVKYNRQKSVEWWLLKPDWNLKSKSFLFKKDWVYSSITFSNMVGLFEAKKDGAGQGGSIKFEILIQLLWNFHTRRKCLPKQFDYVFFHEVIKFLMTSSKSINFNENSIFSSQKYKKLLENPF